MINALHLRKKKKKSPVSYAEMKRILRQDIEDLGTKLGLASENQIDKEDYDVLRGKIIALREMRVKLGLGPYSYYSELWKGVSD